MTAKRKPKKPAPKRAKQTPATPATEAPSTVFVLRACDAERRGRGGFQWPESGPVECPDWSPQPVCGGGLHGWLHGEGDGRAVNDDRYLPGAKWLVVEVVAADIVQLDRKVKFPRGVVVHCGDRASASAWIAEKCPGRTIVGGTATAGDGGTATAGYGGTATAGDYGTATAGDYGTATAGDGGTATAGYGGTATAGDGGTATAGYGGTATAGDGGTATAGDGGTATAGDGGTLVIREWDSASERYRLRIAYVGEGGIKANTKYRVRSGAFVEVAP